MDDLVGAQEIADLLELAGPKVVHEWRRRHRDFPAPVTDLSVGMIWAWPDVRAWAVRTGRMNAAGEPVKLPAGRPKKL